MPDQPRSAGRIKAIPLTEEDSARLRDRLLSVIEGLTREEDLDALSMRSWRESNVFASADGGASARPLRHGWMRCVCQSKAPPRTGRAASVASRTVKPRRRCRCLAKGNAAARSATPALCCQAALPRQAAGSRAIRITCALPNRADSDKRSVTSSSYPSAVPITASCIAPERKWNGGRG
jgi:hypothetical protein